MRRAPCLRRWTNSRRWGQEKNDKYMVAEEVGATVLLSEDGSKSAKKIVKEEKAAKAKKLVEDANKRQQDVESRKESQKENKKPRTLRKVPPSATAPRSRPRRSSPPPKSRPRRSSTMPWAKPRRPLLLPKRPTLRWLRQWPSRRRRLMPKPRRKLQN